MATLSDVKRYMRQHHRASLQDLAIGLSTTQDAAKALLEMWRSKKRVRSIAANCGSNCGKSRWGGCNCASAALPPEIYEWIEDEEPARHDS
ncbi:FeoC-like transcriptional regulator [Xanthobacter sp. TB0139]|uniref:FeoC-like transcriptional regulator n=1 Tax=Xanthobacter sp. TB0139 TaxID=3459178 RepID=UPI00403A22A3